MPTNALLELGKALAGASRVLKETKQGRLDEEQRRREEEDRQRTLGKEQMISEAGTAMVKGEISPQNFPGYLTEAGRPELALPLLQQREAENQRIGTEKRKATGEEAIRTAAVDQISRLEAKWNNFKPKDETESEIAEDAKNSLLAAKDSMNKGGDFNLVLKEVNDKGDKILDWRKAKMSAEATRTAKENNPYFALQEDNKILQASQKLEGEMGKAGIPQAYQRFSELDSKIGFGLKGGEVPGIGPIKGLFPAFMMSAEGKDIRSAIQGVLNVTLKDRSGAVVVDQEFERLKKEIGTYKFATLDDLRSALNRLKNMYVANAKNIEASYVNSESNIATMGYKSYKDGGGITAGHFDKIGGGKLQGSGNKKIRSVAEIQAELDVLRGAQ